MERTLPMILQWDETFDIGSETGTPVDDQDYQVPFKFTGKLNKLTVKLERPELTPADIKRLEETAREKAISDCMAAPIMGTLTEADLLLGQSLAQL